MDGQRTFFSSPSGPIECDVGRVSEGPSRGEMGWDSDRSVPPEAGNLPPLLLRQELVCAGISLHLPLARDKELLPELQKKEQCWEIWLSFWIRIQAKLSTLPLK